MHPKRKISDDITSKSDKYHRQQQNIVENKKPKTIYVYNVASSSGTDIGYKIIESFETNKSNVATADVPATDDLIVEDYEAADVKDDDNTPFRELNPMVPFIDTITPISLKKRLQYGIPCHSEFINTSTFATNKTTACVEENDKQPKLHLDVEKIMTSEDLINILEDDYETDSCRKKQRLDRDTSEVFKIPKIDVVCENALASEISPFDFDEYLQSIISVGYDEDELFSEKVVCSMCKPVEIKLENLTKLRRHTESHSGYYCCICCQLLVSEKALNNHLITEHPMILE